MMPVLKRDAGVGHEAPPDYELAGRWKLNLKGWSLVWLLAGSAIIFGLTIMLGLTIRGLLRGYLEGQFSLGSGFFPLLIVLGVIVAYIILHEGVHGLVFLGFGGKPRFGVKLVGRFFPVAFYATSRAPLLRNQYLLVILAPFLTLTPAFLVIGILANAEGIVTLAIIAMAMNASGSIGDLLMAWKIRRHGRKTLYEDTKDGFNWYVPSRPNL